MEVRDFKKFFKRSGRFVRQPRNDKKTFQRNRDDKNGKSKRKCFRCGDPNHLIGERPKPPRDKNQRAFIGGSWSDNDEEDDEKVNDETCLVAQASNEICLGVNLEPVEWIKDSGCSKHMTGNRKLFSTYKAYNGGNVIFGSNLSGNIISKGQICGNKYRVTFSEHDSEITKDGKVIGRGIRKKGLNVMKLGNKPKDKICLATIDENSTLWHRRLGHANMHLIQSLASNDLVRNLPNLKFDQHFCDACKIRKQAHACHIANNIVSTTRCFFRHMTGNKSFLIDYQEIDGRFVAFGGSPKGGKITRKSKIRTGKLDFKDVYFVKKLKFNLFFVSQMYDKKNNVLFTKTECLVLSPDFKLLDESQVMLKVPRYDNMYSFDLKNVVLSGGKFDRKADEWFLVRYSINSKAFRVFNTETRKVEENLHITFLENKPNVAGSGPDWLFDIDLLTNSMNYEPVTVGNQTNKNTGIKDNVDVVPTQQHILLPLLYDSPQSSEDAVADDAVKKTNEKPVNKGERNGQEKEGGASNKEGDQNVQDFRAELDNFLVQQKEGYATSTNKVSTVSPSVSAAGGAYDDKDEGAEANFNNLETTMNVKPKKVIQALDNPSWIKAMQEELLQFKLQKVWILVDLPNGKRAIGTKWVFRNKMYVCQMDVKSAFLYGTIKKEVYVCQPLGFEDPQFPDKVYKIEKALYGLHQAPRAWYETLSTYLLENRFRRGTTDKTLFIKKDKGDILLVQVYVDDIIFGSTKKSLYVEFE
ncbi:retrovirus-related pol polyprotein from transposon TNT 1-94 [Tanacetum coccineum]